MADSKDEKKKYQYCDFETGPELNGVVCGKPAVKGPSARGLAWCEEHRKHLPFWPSASETLLGEKNNDA